MIYGPLRVVAGIVSGIVESAVQTHSRGHSRDRSIHRYAWRIGRLPEVRLQPERERLVVAGEVPDDDRSQLRLVTLAQEPRVERNGAGQAGDIPTVDGPVPGQLRER